MSSTDNLPKRRVTLCGSLGWGHARDDALAGALVNLAREVGFDLEVDLLAGRALPAVREVIGLGPQDQGRREALRGHPILLAGHGVIEGSAHSLILRCAQFLKPSFASKAALFGATVEPAVSYHWFIRMKLRAVLKRMHKLYVTDISSAELLRSLIKYKPIEVIGDPCFFLPASDGLPPELSNVQRYVVVSLGPQWALEEEWTRWIARRLVELADRLSAQIVFLPMTQEKDDLMEQDGIAEQMTYLDPSVSIIKVNRLLPADQMAAVIKKSVLVLSMRLHACVLAYGQHTPFVGLLEHPRMHAMAATISCLHNIFPAVSFDSLDRHSLGYAFHELPMERQSLTQTALNAMRYTSFESLPHFHNLQKEALAELID